MKNFIGKLLLIGLAVGFCCKASSQVPIFKNGDRVAFVGNSITAAGGFFHDIALFYATRFPDVNIDVINCGVSGNMASQVLARMDSDIVVHKPTVSFLKLGMNDVHRELYTPEASKEPDIATKRQKVLDVFKRDYEQVIQLLQKAGSRVILQTPSIYDETAAVKDAPLHGRNAGLASFAEAVKELAAKYRLQVVDYRTPMLEITRKIQAADSTRTIIGPDRVHPGAVGHFIMAYTFLKTLQGAMPVAALTLNAKGVNRFAGITGFTKKPGAYTFTWLEKALPYPVLPEAEGALNLVPFHVDFNRETLKMINLEAGRYKVLIDSTVIGTFTQLELNDGINLAQNKLTPQYQQAQDVLKNFKKLWQIEGKRRYFKALQTTRASLKNARNLADVEAYFETLRATQTDTASTAYKNVIMLRDTYIAALKNEAQTLQQMRDLHDQIYRDNKPVPHRYQIVRE